MYPGVTDPDNLDNYNSDSILNSVKKLLGIDSEYHAFDPDIIMHINTVLFIMYQMGIGKMYTISDEYASWSDYLGGREDLELIKTYVGSRVRQIFDPPQSSIVADALDKTVKELEWRLFSQTDLLTTFPEDLVTYEQRLKERQGKTNAL